MRGLALAGLLGLLALSSVQRVSVWGSEAALWDEAARHGPNKPRPWINLGAVYARHGETDRAIAAYRHAVALSRDPRRDRIEGPMRGRHVALLNVAVLLAQGGQYDAALALTTEIQPRAHQYEGRPSFLDIVEAGWRAERDGHFSAGF